MSKELYIGLMSGTSIDGLDACLIDMQNGKPEVIDVDSCKWSEAEAKALHKLCQSSKAKPASLSPKNKQSWLIISYPKLNLKMKISSP